MSQAIDKGRVSSRGSAFKCPQCQGVVRCFDSRPGPNNSIRRRRVCLSRDCGYRFTTYEAVIEDLPLSPVAMQFLLVQITEAHEELGRRLAHLVDANKASVLLTSIDAAR
jgi:hypothetical protein